MLHRTAQERYEKLKKEFTCLMDSFSRDDLDDFIQTANSLPNWIRRDGTQEQKDAGERVVASLDWKICNRVANAQKHADMKATPRSKKLPSEAPVVVKSVQCKPGGTGFEVLPSKRVFGAGDEIVVEYNDNRKSALGLVVTTFNHFRYIFEIAAIPPSQRGNRVVAFIKRSIARSAEGDVEGALKYYNEAIRLKHRIKRRRKRRRWLEAGVS
jgi:hypothetical protein